VLLPSLTEFNSGRFFAIIMAGLLLFLGVFRIPVEPMPVLFQIMFETAISIALVSAIILRGNIFVGLFFATAVYSMFIMSGMGTYFTFQGIFYGSVWYLIVVSFFREKHLNYLMNIICIIAIASMFWMGLQLYNLDPLYKPMNPALWGGRQIPTGLMLSRFSVAGLFVFCMPAFLRGYWHFWLIPLIVFIIPTDCKAGYIAIAAGLYFYLFLLARKYLWIGRKRFFRSSYFITGGGMFAYFLVSKGAASFYARWDVWKQAYHLIKTKLLTGAGISHWTLIADNPYGNKFIYSTEGKWWFMHNDFWQAGFDMGIWFLIVCAGFYIHAYRKYHDRAMISYIALGSMTVFTMAWFPFHNPITASIGITWLAILHIQQKNKEGLK